MLGETSVLELSVEAVYLFLRDLWIKGLDFGRHDCLKEDEASMKQYSRLMIDEEGVILVEAGFQCGVNSVGRCMPRRVTPMSDVFDPCKSLSRDPCIWRNWHADHTRDFLFSA